MAIKPKSRAHEERIKALESQCDYFAEQLKDHARILVSIRATLRPRPWYKRIFGL